MPRGEEEAAGHFYGLVLGLSEIPKPANLAHRGGVWFQAGARQLHLGVEDDFRPARKAHAAFRVDDLDDLKTRCRAAGLAPIEDEPIPGFRRFYLADPFGNRLEFLEAND